MPEQAPDPVFPIELWFRNGTRAQVWVVRFDPTYAGDGSIQSVDWEQSPKLPGEMLLVWVDWVQVQMVTSTSMLEPD